MSHAKGTFEVKLAPIPAYEAESGSLGRMSLDKQFKGDIEATSKGEMLTGMGQVKGSAGYVAIERVSGTLSGKKGSFILMHTGIMDRSTPSLTITVVPDSATDELVGMSGRMTIDVTGGQHSYELEYTFASE